MTVSTRLCQDCEEVTNGALELKWWLVNAFNGEWSRITNAVPKTQDDARSVVR
jgi:hypothetical protein